MDADALRAEVADRYTRLGLPTWPNPNPDGPREDAYTRVTDPARYRVVHARARVWAEVLAALPGVTAEPADVDPIADRGTWIAAARQGTLPLLLRESDTPHPVLRICAGRPDAVVAALPDCGCDACDSGSADLLDALDDAVLRVVGAPLVLLRGDGWHAQWHPDGGSAQGLDVDYDRLMELCRRLADGEAVALPAGADALIGRPW